MHMLNFDVVEPKHSAKEGLNNSSPLLQSAEGLYANVLIDHPYARKTGLITYQVPEALELKIGQCVEVPFRSKTLPALIWSLKEEKPEFKTKEILKSLEPEISLQEWQMKTLEWIIEHYFCSALDASHLFLPKGVWKIPKRKKAPRENRAQGSKNSSTRTLSEDQEAIIMHFAKNPGVKALLQGVTGSGKTEVYRELIRLTRDQGKSSILLVPEIALTPQLLHQFESEFSVAVLHSHLTPARRASLWHQIYNNEVELVIGSRSALFAPCQNLGLIILDEEHEWTYKQENSPRYHAREVAKKMAEFTGASLILGSATPSVESRYEAQEKKLHHYRLETRYQGTELPQIKMIDMREEVKGKNFGVLSNLLEQKIETALQNKEHVLLFLNRRGSASATLCRDCGHTMECSHCSVTLTYHRGTLGKEALICHHCGRVKTPPAVCPNCKSPRIKQIGLGTEKVESELKQRFPNARIARADRDTTSNLKDLEELHRALRAHEIDILIGTQMIAKGLDLEKVSLVGILLADLGLHIPDFRASERAFQLLTQVAGRAGRREKQGEVILQTFSPEHMALQLSRKHDYEGFYEQEICSRMDGQMPPFTSLIKLTTASPSKEIAYKSSQTLLKTLELLNPGTYELSSAPALIPKINGKIYWNILIKGRDAEKLLRQVPPEALTDWRIDVDPIQTV